MSAEATPKPLVHMNVVATRLGIPVNSVYSMVRRGILPAVKLGRLWRMDPDRLEAWISGGGQALANGWREEAL